MELPWKGNGGQAIRIGNICGWLNACCSGVQRKSSGKNGHVFNFGIATKNHFSSHACEPYLLGCSLLLLIKVFGGVSESKKAFFLGFVSDLKLISICRVSGFPAELFRGDIYYVCEIISSRNCVSAKKRIRSLWRDGSSLPFSKLFLRGSYLWLLRIKKGEWLTLFCGDEQYRCKLTGHQLAYVSLQLVAAPKRKKSYHPLLGLTALSMSPLYEYASILRQGRAMHVVPADRRNTQALQCQCACSK